MEKRKGLIMLFVLMLLIQGCGSKDAEDETSSDEPVEITVWAHDPNFNIPIMETAADLFMKENEGVNIKVEEISDYPTALNTVLSSGEKEGLPNVIRIEDYSSKKLLTSFEDSFIPLGEYVDYDNFLPYKSESVHNNDIGYGVPFDSAVAGYFYREDVFTEAGYDQDDLMHITWDEFIDIAKDVKAKTGKEIIGTVSPLHSEGDTLRMLLHSNNTWFFDEEGNLDIAENEGFRESMKMLKRLNDEGIVKGYDSWGARSEALQNGELAGILNGSWVTSTIKTNEDQKGLWSFATPPRFSNVKESVNSSNMGGSSWYVLDTGNDKENEVAVKFLTSIFDGNLEFYEKIMNEQSAVPSYLPAQELDVWDEKDEFFSDKKLYKFFKETMDEVPDISYGIYTYEIEDVLGNHKKDYLEGKIDLDEFIDRVVEEYELQFGN